MVSRGATGECKAAFAGMAAELACLRLNLVKVCRSCCLQWMLLLPAACRTQELFVYNRTASKAQPLTSDPDLSIQLAASPAEVAASCSIMCLMLAGAGALCKR